jgi:hypothetical protein
MPLLPDPKHEAYAQGLAKGKSQTEAYKLAGYKGDRTAASRLSTNVNIQARVQELQSIAANKVIDDSVFDAKKMFRDLLQDIEDAKAGGDYKAAADLRKFFIRCFGYEDSPTLTQEHVKGTKIPETKHREGDDAPVEPRDTSNVSNFAEALRKLKNRVA